MRNSTMPSRSPFVRLGIKEFLQHPSDPLRKKRVLNFISSFKEVYDFQSIFLLDRRGKVLLSTPEGKGLDCPHFRKIVDESVRKNQIVLTDLHRVESDGRIHIGAVTPIRDPENNQSTPIAVLVFEINPHRFLYPQIQSWPVYSQTSETLLFRREGEEVVYLNELRHRQNTALNLRFSIHEEQLPAAMAIRGKEGIVEGLDYRGVPVIAVIRRIPDSPWFLIAKVDKEEIYAPIQDRAKVIGILVGILIIVSGVVLSLLWYQQRSQYYREQIEAELKHQTLVQRFDYLSRYANDIILMFDQDLKILEANERALSSYGYSREELIGMNIRNLIPRELQSTLDAQIKRVEMENGLIYETVHQRRDGTTFPVEISSRLIEVQGRKVYQSIIRDISERKHSENLLRDSQAELSAIVENIPVILMILDKERRVREVNGMAAKFARRSAEEMMGLRGGEALRCLHSLDDPKGCGFGLFCETCTVRNTVLETFNTGKSHHRLEAKLPFNLNGQSEEIHFLLSTVPLTISNEPMVLVCIEDITPLKRAEEALRSEKTWSELIVSSAPNIIVGLGEGSKILIFNNFAEKLTGYKAEEVIGKSWIEIFIPEKMRGQLYNVWDEIVKNKLIEHHFENPILTKYGEEKIISWSNTVLTSEGQFRMVLSIGEDITERKQVEQALRASEEQYRMVVDNAGDGIIIAQNGSILFTNRRATEIMGFTQEEFLNKPFIEFIHPEDRQMVLDYHLRRLVGEKLPEVYQFRVIDKVGNVKWVEINVVLITYQGKPATLNFIRDLTERKRMEGEMASLQSQLQQAQKMEAIGKLAGGVAHDFNNLLSVIKGTCQLSLLDLREGDPLYGNLKEIERASDRAADLTRQLLAFSRKQIMEMRVLDLNDVIKGFEKMLKRIIGEDIELVTYLSEGLGRVKVDQAQMEQAIINIVVNARDAMPKGGRLTIETANVELDEEYARRHIGVKPGSYVMVAISDTGVGMTPEVKDRIFEPFFTTKEMGMGTGLGLSTVYGIVKQSGGNIWVYSEPGRGATFKIYLPRVDEEVEEVRREVYQEIPFGSETVLVVEDEETVRKLAVRLLKRQGYRVLEAPDGGQAFILCERYTEPIHLILSDVVMPGISGRELVERLQRIHPEAKALYMSGYTDNVILHHGILEEGLNFIQKPFTLESLARKVREVLDKK